MGWIQALRKAEQQGREVAQRGVDVARDTWEDAERRLRRKMRIFPERAKRNATGRMQVPSETEPEIIETGMEAGSDKHAA